jgi:hypothetical protein
VPHGSNFLSNAAIAQSVERLICNQQVGSSILSGGWGSAQAYARPFRNGWDTKDPSR